MGAKSFSFSKTEQGETFHFPPSLSNEEIKKLLLASKGEVKAANKAVFALLESEHKAASALELKNKLVLLDKYMTSLADFLDDRLDGTENTEKENTLKVFSKTCDQLSNRVDKMNRMLSDDVSICQHRESKEAKDVIKIITYVVGLPTLAANFAKLFFEEKSHVIPYVAIGSIAIGTWFAFPEETRKIWRSTETMMCRRKKAVQNNFLLYYANSRRKEITASSRDVAKKIFGLGRPSL